MPPFSIEKLVSAASSEHAQPCISEPKGPLVPLKKSRKSVTFNERVRAKKSIHFADLTDEEIQDYWYTEADFETMKNGVRFEATLLENGCLHPAVASTRYCNRGLEAFTPEGARRRTKNKKYCRTVVIEEKRLQREEGSYDQEYIAEIYAVAVASSRSEARALALQDETDALQ